MQKILAQEQSKDIKIVYIDFAGDGSTRKLATLCKNGEAIHCELADLFVFKKVIDQACREILKGV